jgi:late competence protein required for DNA uptake (superfamily II DNA/RNA helicase)
MSILILMNQVIDFFILGGIKVDYKEGHSASWDWKAGKDHYHGKIYQCADCAQSLQDNETYTVSGTVYCGSCYQGK